jgi:hypothetical protein
MSKVDLSSYFSYTLLLSIDIIVPGIAANVFGSGGAENVLKDCSFQCYRNHSLFMSAD